MDSDVECGMGLSCDLVILSLHRNYTSYLDLKKWLDRFDFLQPSRFESFLVNLEDKVRYQPLTLMNVAEDIFADRSMKPNVPVKAYRR